MFYSSNTGLQHHLSLMYTTLYFYFHTHYTVLHHPKFSFYTSSFHWYPLLISPPSTPFPTALFSVWLCSVFYIFHKWVKSYDIFALSIILSKLIHVICKRLTFLFMAEENSVVYVYTYIYTCIYMYLGLGF